MSASQQVDPAHLGVRRRWFVQFAVGLSTLITTFDTSSINVSLHTLAVEFAVDPSTVAWLPLLGFLVVTSTLLLFGRLSDLFGSKIVFTAGFVVYAAGGLFCGLAPSFYLLLLARGLQAVGLSMLSANAMAILTACFPPHQRGVAVGVASTIVGLGYFVGPVAAGFIITTLGWRYVFFTSVPVCLLALGISMLVLPQGASNKDLRFDFLGAALFAAAATSFLLAINAARSSALTAPPVLGLGLVAVVAVFLFVSVERRVSEPMLALSLFRVRLFSFSLASAFFLFVGITGEELLVPLFLQQVLLQSPAAAGLAMAVVPFIRMLLSSPSGYLSDRFGPRAPSSLGAGLTALGVFGLSRMDASTPMIWLLACLVLIGLGTGFYFSPNMHATMASVPQDRLGIGSGALGLRRNLGQSFGVAVAAYLLQTGGSGVEGQVGGFQLGFAVGAFCAALAALAALAAGARAAARGPARGARAAG